MITPNQKAIIDALSEEIVRSASRCAGEQYAPSHDADGSDQFMRLRKEEMLQLRNIRQQLEDIFSGVLL